MFEHCSEFLGRYKQKGRPLLKLTQHIRKKNALSKNSKIKVIDGKRKKEGEAERLRGGREGWFILPASASSISLRWSMSKPVCLSFRASQLANCLNKRERCMNRRQGCVSVSKLVLCPKYDCGDMALGCVMMIPLRDPSREESGRRQ